MLVSLLRPLLLSPLPYYNPSQVEPLDDPKDKLMENRSFIGKFIQSVYNTFYDILTQGVKDVYHKEMFKDLDLKSVTNCITTIAITITAICFLIDLIQNVLLKTDELRGVDVLKALMKLVMAKAICSWAPTILEAMSATAGDIITSAVNSKGLEKAPKISYTGSTFALLPKEIEDLTYFCGHIIEILALLIGCIITMIKIITIKMELKIYEILSPLPMAFIPWSETKDMPKKFLFNYFAVGLQAAVLVIASFVAIHVIKFFDTGLGVLDGLTNTSQAFNYALACIAYIVLLMKSESLTKQILGIA